MTTSAVFKPPGSGGVTTRLDIVDLTLIGISSFPKGAGGYVEVYYPESASKPCLVTTPMPQPTHTLNAAVKIKIGAADVDPIIHLKFFRKRANVKEGKEPIVDVAEYSIVVRETLAGMFTIQIGDTTGKLKFSIASYDSAGAPVLPSALAADADDEDDLLPRLLPRFKAATQTGTITIQQLAQIAVQLGIDCDFETLAAVVPKESHDSVFLEDCIDYLARALRDERAGDTGAVITSTTARDANGEVAPLSPFDYLSRKWSGTLQPDDTWSCAALLTARNLLLLSTLLTLSSCAAVIIAYTSVTWLNGALSRQRDLLLQTQSMMARFMNSFENVIMSSVSDAIIEKTQTTAAFFERLWYQEQLEVAELMGKEISRVLPAWSSVGTLTTLEYVQALYDRLAGVQALIPLATTSVGPSVIVDLVKKWQRLENSVNARGVQVIVRPLDVPDFEPFTWHWEWVVVGRRSGQWITDLSMPTDTFHGGLSAVDIEARYCPSQVEFALQSVGGVLKYDTPDPQGSAQTYTTIAARIVDTAVDLCFVLTPYAKRSVSISWMSDRTNDINSAANPPLPDEPVLEEFAIWTTQEQNDRAKHLALQPSYPDTGMLVQFSDSILTSGVNLCGIVDCTETARWVDGVRKSNSTELAVRNGIVYYDGVPSIIAALYLPSFDVVVTLRRAVTDQLDAILKRQVEAFDYLNFNFVLTTELVVTGVKQSDNSIIPQQNILRFSDDCHGGPAACERSYWGSQTGSAALRTRTFGAMIRPDYRPEPCVSAYAYIGGGVDRATVIERDVQDIRNGALNALVSIVKEINQHAYSTYEMMMLQFNGFRVSKTFDQNDFSSCNEVYCIVRDGIVVWRSDCIHCEKAPTFTSNSSFRYLTPLRFPNECANANGGVPCDNDALNNLNANFVRSAMLDRPSGAVAAEGTDYRGALVSAAYMFLDNLTATVIYKVDISSLQGPILQSITISSVVASACMIIGLIAVVFVTTFVIGRSEKESELYKTQVNAEKERFAASVAHLVPPHVAPKLTQVQQSIIVVETSPSAVVVNIDLVGFGEKARGWTASQFLTYTSYHFTVLVDLAKRYHMFNLKSFGDVFVAVGGFGRIDDKRRDDCVMEAAKFAVIVIQLMSSKEFSHGHAVLRHSKSARNAKGVRARESATTGGANDKHPAATNRATDIYKTLPQTRIGCHTGHLVMGFVDVGSTPRYDAFGPTMQVAARMQTTAPPSRIHCSQEFKEALERGDVNFEFEFDVQRRTILKGRATHGSFLLKSAHVPVPEDFIASMEIQRADLALDFEKPSAEDQRRQGDASSSVASSMKSGKSGKSMMSARSGAGRQ